MTKRLLQSVVSSAVLVVCLAATAQQKPAGLTVTTSSAEARALFYHGLGEMQTLHREEALQNWREAAQADPEFALAHIFLAELSRDPAEQLAERDKAVAARKSAGPEEQLIVDWIANASRSQWVPAIQAMNTALADYPDDKDLAWLAGLWLENQRESERAIPLFERANRIDPNFADPLNQAAYCYARLGNFNQAFADMQRYAALLPDEANPQDSLAEISRMAGRFRESIFHYHASLKIDPTFIESQAGLGDTYAVMGEESKARAEYDTAIQNATNRVEIVTFSMQSAATYAREQDFAKADPAFQDVATEAHENDLGTLEAEAWRRMSVYQKDNTRAMELLSKAETVLKEPHKMTVSAREEELALVLRTRVGRAVHDGSMEAALAGLKQLRALAATNNSGRVQFALSGAEGAVLMGQGKFQEAIAHLEEDDKNPFSLQRLIIAYQKAGDKDKAARMSQRLAHLYEPTIEQAVVVPEFQRNLLFMKDKN
ncbi:MAG TPA: tetratricopeptide repeat protein [Candidatus Angelobacter sp.]|nr:tetratricopeptide repeat protein [Candidatus Angelobacter sp.]